MTPRILLHIGSPKCGSTYLQRVMLQNQDILKKHGIKYPHDGQDHPGNAADLEDINRDTLLEYFEGNIHTTILSHEDLYSLEERGIPLAKLSKEHGINVQLFAFLRPFSEFVYGDYSQFMKQFFYKFLAERNPYGGQDFKSFAHRRIDRMHPEKYLRCWQSLFPELPLALESHHNIRPLMRQFLGPDVEGSLNWEVPSNKVNRSLRMEDCDRIAEAIKNPDIPEKTIREIHQNAFHHVHDPDAGKTAERTEWLERKFAFHNADLLREFGFDNRKKT